MKYAGARLTAAEEALVRHVREGLSNAEIARERGTSRHTVAKQISSILRKLELSGRRAMAIVELEANDDSVPKN